MSEPKRIQMRRTKGWRKPEGAIVVSRPSRWGNPYRVDEYRDDWPGASEHELRRMATSDFHGMVEGRWDIEDENFTYPSFETIRADLAGHDLACWCPLDQPCHADVLLEIANGASA